MTERIRCKMICHAVTPNEYSNGELCTVSLGAVYSQNPATEDFIYGKATPYAKALALQTKGQVKWNQDDNLAAIELMKQAIALDAQAQRSLAGGDLATYQAKQREKQKLIEQAAAAAQ